MPKQLRCPVTGKLIDLENPVWRDSVTGKLITPDNLAFRDPVTGRFVEGLRFRDPVTGRIVEEQDGFLIFRSPVTGALMTVEVVPKHDYLHIVGQQLFVPNTTTGQVKSAILMGNTLNNEFTYTKFNGDTEFTINFSDGVNTIFSSDRRLEPNTVYTLFIYFKENTLLGHTTPLKFQHSSGSIGEYLDIPSGIVGWYVKSFTSANVTNLISLVRRATTSGQCVIGVPIIVKGNLENTTIPFDNPFTGMQSSKMPVLLTRGKNCLNEKLNEFEMKAFGNVGDNYDLGANSNIRCRTVSPFEFSKGSYVISLSDSNYQANIGSVQNGVLTGLIADWIRPTFTITDETKIAITLRRKDNATFTLEDVKDIKIQIETGTVATPHEDFKTNILTCLEEVELRGVGDVRDTLNVLTGEKVESIGEVVLNGSEGWTITWRGTNHTMFTYNSQLFINETSTQNLYCDTFPVKNAYQQEYEGIYIQKNTNSPMIRLTIANSKLSSIDANGIKNYLINNNAVVQFIKPQKAIKTVALSGNKVPTYLGGTHFTASSETLAPTFEGDVPIIKPTLQLYEREC